MVLERNKGSWGLQTESHRSTVPRPLWPTTSAPRLLERRREARYPTNDPAKVDVPYEKITGLDAVVVDVSRSGLRLALKQSIGRGMLVKIALSSQLIIFGEVRYCRRTGGGFHAGILVQDASLPEPHPDQHIQEDELAFYLVGKGLSVAEIIRLKAHLMSCKPCQTRLGAADAVLNPVRKSRV